MNLHHIAKKFLAKPPVIHHFWLPAKRYIPFTFTDYLKKYLILAAPGSGFGGKGWFRLAYCVSEKTIENSEKAFVKAMEEI